MKISFTKMCAIGNDFVVIDGTKQKYTFTKENIKAITDRHFGIGCDQVLLLENANTSEIDFFITIYNTDGTLAEQCGNGMRCITKFIKDNNLSQKNNFNLATFARKIQTQIEDDGKIKVNMGLPIFEPNLIPFTAVQKKPKYIIANIELGVVSIGNPHAVILVTDINTAPVNSIGKILCEDPHFPNGVNVNFMQIENRKKIKLRVYERGTGETLACGSGSCASFAVGRLWNLLDETVTVELPGGTLQISQSNLNVPIFLIGNATSVFTGTISIL